MADIGFTRTLDMLAGIDAWQIVDQDGAMRGLASRIQWPAKAWDSFTIRKSRTNGARTELEKRLWALEHQEQGWLYPALTIQAYISKKRTGSLLSVAVTRTTDLFNYVRTGREGQPDDETADWYTKSVDNATFVVVPWARYRRSNRAIGIIKPEPTTPGLRQPSLRFLW